MVRACWVLALVVFTGGCTNAPLMDHVAGAAGAGFEREPLYDVDVLQAVGQRFHGKPFTEMLGRYGVPLRHTVIQGVDAYSWEAERKRYFRTQPPAKYHCQLDAYVRDGVTVSVGVAGEQGACIEFIP